MVNGTDFDTYSERLRGKAIRGDGRFLIASFMGSEQEKDASRINCDGFGRIRTLAQEPRPGWVGSCVRYRVGKARLSLSEEESEFCQVFQNAVCNYRCWFCFVDYQLLSGDTTRADYLTAGELVDKFLAESFRPQIIALSGGQPDLMPEWAPRFIRSLLDRKADEDYYVWIDDNLSTYFAWEYLTSEDWHILKSYPYVGRLCGIKSFTKERFAQNTGVPAEYFDRQIDVLARLVREGLDVYIEMVLATESLDDVEKDISAFFDLLQRKVHRNIPLRINPCEIRSYTPTRSRLTQKRKLALENQYKVLSVWLEELNRRFSSDELALPQHSVSLD